MNQRVDYLREVYRNKFFDDEENPDFKFTKKGIIYCAGGSLVYHYEYQEAFTNDLLVLNNDLFDVKLGYIEVSPSSTRMTTHFSYQGKLAEICLHWRHGEIMTEMFDVKENFHTIEHRMELIDTKDSSRFDEFFKNVIDISFKHAPFRLESLFAKNTKGSI